MAVDLPSRSTRRGRPAGRAIHYLLLFATCALVANALIGESGLLAIRIANDRQSRLTARIAALKAENDALREEARRLREDPTLIEAVARRELGLIHPGERVFIIRPAPAETDPLSTDVQP